MEGMDLVGQGLCGKPVASGRDVKLGRRLPQYCQAGHRVRSTLPVGVEVDAGGGGAGLVHAPAPQSRGGRPCVPSSSEDQGRLCTRNSSDQTARMT